MNYCPILCPICNKRISPDKNYTFMFFCDNGCDSQLHYDAEWTFRSFAWRIADSWAVVSTIDDKLFRLVVGPSSAPHVIELKSFDIWNLEQAKQWIKTVLVFQ